MSATYASGFDDGFKQAAAMVEAEREMWRKSTAADAGARADALTYLLLRMSVYVTAREAAARNSPHPADGTK